MHILITNDDGIDSPGLWALAGALHSAGYGKITVIAPALDQSGIAMGFPPRREHTLTPFAPPDPTYHEIDAYAHDGTPVGCVTAAMLSGVVPRPDVVVSGINRGLNSGTNVMLSGTVGAAMAGALWGCQAMAISQQFVGDAPMTWATAAWVAARVFPLLAGLPPNSSGAATILNVNVPRAETPTDLLGMRQTVVSNFFFGHYLNAESERSAEGVHTMRYRFDRTSLPFFSDTSDDGAVRAGYVSITPLSPMGVHTGLDLSAAIKQLDIPFDKLRKS
jgi:5'-nucleotidase